mgnify:CR=1 FL=1
MRLALLTHEPFYPPSGGGSAEANYLVSELTRRGHEVHLFCPDFPDRDAIAARKLEFDTVDARTRKQFEVCSLRPREQRQRRERD